MNFGLFFTDKIDLHHSYKATSNVEVTFNLSRDPCTRLISPGRNTAQKIKFSIKDLFSKCDQIRSFLSIWSHLLKKSLMENFIFGGVETVLEYKRNLWSMINHEGGVIQCVKSVPIWSFFGLCFSAFGPEKLRIRRLFTLSSTYIWFKVNIGKVRKFFISSQKWAKLKDILFPKETDLEPYDCFFLRKYLAAKRRYFCKKLPRRFPNVI